MKKYIFTLLAAAGLSFTACDDVLERPQLNVPTDETFWRTEQDAKMFAYSFYPHYFTGYSSTWTYNYTPIRFYYFSDDFASGGKQRDFENSVPSSRGTTSESYSAEAQVIVDYQGANWNFAWIRKANIFRNRLETRMKGVLSEEAYNHWYAVATFFKCYSYARLVATFGDVPYFEEEVASTDFETQYKDRDSRVFVMDKVYDMLKNEVLPNMRSKGSADANTLNRDVAAAYASRWMLFEGTWQKYHGGDQAAAKKYLEFAKDCAEMVMGTQLYAIDAPFHELFGSQDLKGNKEALMYRHYDDKVSIMHCIGSYSNGATGQSPAPNLALAKSFICQDGKVYQNSELEGADILDIKNMSLTRDPRFESTFIDAPNTYSSTLLFSGKFIDRAALALEDPNTVPMYASNTNTNDAPVIRYAEVLLNWIEAKAELGSVTQEDLNKSVNLLRSRPLDDVAKKKGITNTVPMKLDDITADFDPARDLDVSPLLWEIRRERRMELVYEYSRLHDIKRWKKLDYMDNTAPSGMAYADNMLGLWIDVEKEARGLVWTDTKEDDVIVSSKPNESKVGKLQVMKADGTVVTYDGTNASDMVGYYIPEGATPRDAFSDRSYVAPIGEAQINDYAAKGYTLTQTKGW